MDPDAWKELYQSNLPRLYSYIRRRVDSVAVAEDLAAQVFLEVLERIGGFTYRGIPIAAWLFRIPHNLVVSHYRHQARLSKEPPDESRADPGGSVEAEVELGFLRTELRAALSELTEEQRRVVVLRFIQGMSTREVASIFKRPAGAIKALQHRGLAAMRRFLSERLGQWARSRRRSTGGCRTGAAAIRRS